ncbi:glycosyl hydrolase [Lentzea flaviverrucosa]|uniref:Ricin-type beta-trefoil lectin domain-containing protein n=1 Tax=Lentzea flaviverrucosa TaxID=200379 RepID=A0A1H9WUY4_9PSEU|nr:glycosyl hydrolase [Lentzea flaviverrucosa]RDI23130.1 ricin-type beta-trefoil lectin protein [Lentzea flaviverrucosa]SES37738.1 Ricin-type beta-trefoil lectin domain-containing protein [Lentzea flaviverrucosa]
MRALRRTGRALLAVALVLPALTLIAGPAAAAPAPLVGVASGRCLDVVGASQTVGTAVGIWDCNGQSNQAWEFSASGELRVFGGARCLDVPNQSTTPGTRLTIHTCSGGANQKFRLNANGSITATQSGLCLDVENQGTANGTAVDIWTCNGQSNQTFRIGSTGPGPQPCATNPVNPNASTQARKLLCYVQSQYGNHIISGQQESTWIGGPDYEINHIRNNTGKYPAIRALDFGDSKDLAPRAIAWWNAGGIPMIGYHMGAPTKPDTYEGTQMQVSINAVLTPGTAEYQSFMQRLDQAAAMLQQLENAGAAVIWRPFHEAGGTWFWWSKEGGGQYNRLWNFMFNYFTRTKGLDNLVWLHGYNGQPQSSFYPGKSVVDIGGADTYAGNGNYDPLNAMYNSVRNIVGSTIPIALHENGPIPDPDRLQSTGTRWVLFGTWHGNHLTQGNSIAHLQKVYNHSYVVTRDELPNLR